MNLLIIFLCIIGAMFARLEAQNNAATITKYVFENNGLGDYYYEYETSDGQSKKEKGELRNKGTDQEAMYVVGSYSYTGDDGNTYYVNYTADENGFHPMLSIGRVGYAAGGYGRGHGGYGRGHGGYGGHAAGGGYGGLPRKGISSAAMASLAGGGIG